MATAATAARLWLGVRAAGRRQEAFQATIAAKVEYLAVTLGVNRGRFVHRHSAHWIFGHCSLPSFSRTLTASLDPCSVCDDLAVIHAHSALEAECRADVSRQFDRHRLIQRQRLVELQLRKDN